MRGKSAQQRPDLAVAQLAARQHGVVSLAQMEALGLSPDAVERRAAAGRLHRLHRGVYAVGHTRLASNGRFMAAVLACGSGAALSHASAAALWGLPWPGGAGIHVTVPGRGARRRRRGIIVHRAPLGPGERVARAGIAVTSPGRTLVDLADHGRRRALERAIDEAAFLRLDVRQLGPRHGRHGSGLVAAVLRDHEAGSTRTRSDLEELVLDLCRRDGLPVPGVNTSVEGYEVDFAWAEARLILESDGHAAHGTRAAFERDRVRDAELTAAGWRVIRVTHRRLRADPARVAAQLRRLLGRA